MHDDQRPGASLAARLCDPELYATDPHPLYARLREEAPVAWNDELGFWAISKHSDVTAVESDHAAFCARRGILVDEIGTTYPSPPTIMHTDPPEHSRYRRLVQPGFRPTAVRMLEPGIRQRTKALVDSLRPGVATDVVPDLAVPLPLQVISQMLGVPDEEWERCYRWSEAVIPGATDWPEAERQSLLSEMIEYLLENTKIRRSRPSDDILTELAHARLGDDQLTDDELTMFLVQLLVAGNETTRNLISAGLVALAERPDQWNAMRLYPALIQSAVEELLRWTTPVISFMRTATHDTEIDGVKVYEGEHVLMLFASANRDTEVFGETAGSLDVTRSPNPHLAFGFGNHFCLGAALARLEARVVLEEILGRFATIEIAGPVERSSSSVIAGVRRADLRFVAG
jgi:cytochrome P450